MTEELVSLNKNRTWKIFDNNLNFTQKKKIEGCIDLPKEKKAIVCKRIFKRKPKVYENEVVC